MQDVRVITTAIASANTGSPVIERPDGTWRAIEKGLAVQPSQVSSATKHDQGPCLTLIQGVLVFFESLQGLHATCYWGHAPGRQLV